ncbi:MAG TPA: SUMF1/EgtB/PvdO family nonheme iron enzyme [Thermoanaerobaculia bacterium]|nr:SUMF1/EgtB/PvdO family nonheme iron enzyme [Thermoanaerobaculia bacterium]
MAGKLREAQEAWERQQRFRERVCREQVVENFEDPQRLATSVVAALHRLHMESAGSASGVPSSPLGPDEAALRTAYLNRLLEQTGFLSLSGIDPAVASEKHTRLQLGAVYTALMTSWKLQTRESSRPLSALEMLDRNTRLVLLGDPGSGKSTFVNFVALCLAGEALGREDANLRLLTSPLPEDELKPWERDHRLIPQPWQHGMLLPIRIVLRDFAARGLPEAGEMATARDLWQFLETELEEAGLADFFPVLRRELLAGRGLVLLDGLDEVPEAERLGQILQVIQNFSGGLGKSRVLVTSRTYAYRNLSAWRRLLGFKAAILAPFSRGQIDRFVGLWYRQMVALGRFRQEDAEGRASLLRGAIFSSDRLLGLAERPLLLTLMASLHAWRGGSLPERREELYAEAVELLLNTWERQRMTLDRKGQSVQIEPSLAEWLRVDRQEVRQALEELAFEAHGAQPDQEGTADVEEGKLVGRLLHLSRNPGADAVQLLTYLRDRAGLLVERGVGVYTFPHRTFQEYLAACHLTGGSFPEEAARLGREDPGRWREAVLLAGAKAARGAVSSAWQLADALCFQEPGGPGTGLEDEWGALLAGQVLAESADLGRVSGANAVKLDRVRRWLLQLMRTDTFPVLERAAAGRALATLGDPRFDTNYWYLPREPLLGFVKVSAGPFQMGSNKGDPGAYENEIPRHEVHLPQFYIARYPVTLAQFRAFVEASGYEPADPCSLKGLANHPVVRVTWYDAIAYCRWLAERLRELAQERKVGEGGLWAALAADELRVCLPSEAEWEKAARGSDGRLYPWGNEADPNRANYAETGLLRTSAVGSFVGGSSPNACEDMGGNVEEWTRSVFGELGGPAFGYPYVAEDGRENIEASSQHMRVVRSGMFAFISRSIRCARRNWINPTYRLDFTGFRVVLSPFRSDL